MMMHFIILNDVYVRVRTGAGAAGGIGCAVAEDTGSCEQPHTELGMELRVSVGAIFSGKH